MGCSQPAPLGLALTQQNLVAQAEDLEVAVGCALLVADPRNALQQTMDHMFS
jgi:hypothetical protein